VASIPATNTVDYIGEPNQPVVNPVKDALNGRQLDPSLPNFGQFFQEHAYLTDPAAQWPYPYTTQHTANREVVVWYDAGQDRFWAFSGSPKAAVGGAA
jgi:hypothetical protein